MPMTCCVVGCRSRFYKGTGVQYFSFPLKYPEKVALWLHAMCRENWNPTKHSRICSAHFKVSDYLERPGINFPRLREDAVPSVFEGLPKRLQEKKPKTKASQIKAYWKGKILESIKYDGITLDVLDQLLLPDKKKYENILNVDEGWEVIRSMKVTGATAISVVGALSLAVELKPSSVSSKNELHNHIRQRLLYLTTAQPMVDKLKQMANSTISYSFSLLEDEEVSVWEMKNKVIEEMESLMKKDISVNKSIGLHGSKHILSNAEGLITILTHSNTGSLATAGYGTALGVVRSLHQQEKLSHVYFTKTRPYNQGTRLTAYELLHDQIPATAICDSMVSALLCTKKISAVVVGAEKIAANGDTANEIGTYHIAISALYHGVPFYVATPSSTFDMTLENGSLIPVEERPPFEVIIINSKKIAADGINHWNPAFDITPAELITGGIITEHGVFSASSLKKLKEYWNPSKLFS